MDTLSVDPNRNNPSVAVPPEVLWTIFKMNNRMFDDITINETGDVLNVPKTLRICSHVCRYWRSIIVGSPSLWAQSLDTDEILAHSERQLDLWNHLVTDVSIPEGRIKWMNEILRRTKGAPLWIRSDRITLRGDLPFILRFLKKEWHRIERIWATIFDAGDLARKFDSLIKRPAPCLQEYSLEIGAPGGQYLPLKTTKTLFDDTTPLLKKLQIRGFNISPESSWLSNIQSLIMNPDFLPRFGSFSWRATDMLNALQKTSHLQELQLINCRIADTKGTNGSETPSFTLPALNNISLVMSLKDSSFLLQHITPPPHFSLRLDVKMDLSDIDAGELDAVADSEERFLKFHSHEYLSIKEMGTEFKFSIKTSAEMGEKRPEFLFLTHWSETVTGHLIAAFSVPGLSSVKQLTLDDKTCGPPEIFTDLLPKLNHLHTLTIEATTFATIFTEANFFKGNAKSTTTLLPYLHTIALYGYSHGSSDIEINEQTCTVLRRLTVQNSGLELDTRKYYHITPAFLQSLEQVSGLKILYLAWPDSEEEHTLSSLSDISDSDDEVTVEHICGTGLPEV